MKAYVIAVSIGIATVSVPLFAQSDSEDTVSEEREISRADTMRCSRIWVTGSRVRRTRVCMTNAQWDDYTDGTRRDAAGLLDRATTSAGQAACPTC